MKRQRIEEISILRAFAFLAIVMQHCIAEYIYRADILPPDEIMMAMLFHFTRFGTPTFVFMSGVILFYNYSSKLNYNSYIKKRALDILIPFICWTIVYWASVSSFSMSSPFSRPSTWRELGWQFINPTYGYHLWFIVMIFQFYLLLPLFTRIAKAIKPFIVRASEKTTVRRTLWLIAAAGAIYTGMLWFSYYKAPGVAAQATGVWKWLLTYRGQFFIAYFFYFLLGAVCAYGLAKWRQLALGTFVWSGFLFIGLYVWAGYELLNLSMDSMKLAYSTYLRPTTFFLITAQLWTVYGIALQLDKHGGVLRRIFLFIGRHSFGGFLAHAFVLMLISQITRPMYLSGYHLPVAVLTFVGTAAGAIGLSKLLSVLPFGWLLTGAPGKSRKSQTAEGQVDRQQPAQM
jgi:surface polysaccharide O-acyltransferase-like enzyme